MEQIRAGAPSPWLSCYGLFTFPFAKLDSLFWITQFQVKIYNKPLRILPSTPDYSTGCTDSALRVHSCGSTGLYTLTWPTADPMTTNQRRDTRGADGREPTGENDPPKAVAPALLFQPPNRTYVLYFCIQELLKSLLFRVLHRTQLLLHINLIPKATWCLNRYTRFSSVFHK